MQKLFHLSTINKYLQWFEDDWDRIRDFTKKHGMDGIELGLTPDYPIERIPEGIVKGVHLRFYPMWLEFWRGDQQLVQKLLGSEEEVKDYYGGLEPSCLVTSYKKQYERAKQLKASYMVFHVSHIRIEDSFTMTYAYTDEEVIDATIELINEVFPADEEGPKLLFENLWWPGLTYTKPHLVKRLLEGINYTQKGCLLDLSHLIITNPKLRSPYQCYTYIQMITKQLRAIGIEMEGVHLNYTLPRDYMIRDHSHLLENYRKATTKQQKNKILKSHIQRMDPHQPFDDEIVQKIIQTIAPKYCVYETNPSSIYEMAHFIKRQNNALGYK